MYKCTSNYFARFDEFVVEMMSQLTYLSVNRKPSVCYFDKQADFLRINCNRRIFNFFFYHYI